LIEFEIIWVAVMLRYKHTNIAGQIDLLAVAGTNKSRTQRKKDQTIIYVHTVGPNNLLVKKAR
jgi:hypothetical protein